MAESGDNPQNAILTSDSTCHDNPFSIAAYTVNSPTFWRSAPNFWFQRLEAQFELARITTENAKFNHVLSALDEDMIRIVSDVLQNPDQCRPYTKLKEALIARLTKMIKTGWMCHTFKTASRLYHGKGAPELTQVRYNINRGKYATLGDEDMGFFEKVLGSSNISTDPQELTAHNTDFLRSVRGNSKVILKPTSTEQISEVLKYCNKRKLAVCPQGGNTGLVGGSVPVFDEVILSLKKLNNIENVDEVTGILVCQSGCVLETLAQAAAERDLTFPLDLGSKGSCLIGGNVSTNAGGLHVLRYGNLHGSVLGLEAVLPNGTVLDLMSKYKKDNTGYHLKHMFIGSEGTLGVITKVAILCASAPKSIHVAFLGLSSFDNVLKTFLRAKRQLGEILSACEMMDATALQCSVNSYNLHSPIEGYPFYMVIEASGSNANHNEEKFNNFLESGINEGEICDGTFTNEPGKSRKIWELREFIPTALIKDGYCFKYDISVPLRQFYDIVPSTQKQVGDLATHVCGYGHLGDSNLHLNISSKEYTQELHQRIEPFVYEYTSRLGGSVSAEHGIGFHKTKYLGYSKSPEAIQVMRDLKRLIDPNGILNPYKVLC